MKRLLVLVEGQSEERFVTAVLRPHLLPRGTLATPIVVATRRERGTGRKTKGGGQWKKWRKDLRRVIADNPDGDARFTTLFDLYGLPPDFPGIGEHGADGDTVRRAEKLEATMAADLNEHRLIPYLQRHEFEALVLAGLDTLVGLLDEAQGAGVQALRTELAGTQPEDVNDGPTTHPSARLLQHVPGYQKTLHGPLAVEGLGLEALRAACPRFGSWLNKLEQLGAPAT